MSGLSDGRLTAEYLMKQWEIFNEYAESKKMTETNAYRAAMKHVFFKAADHYRIAFVDQQDTTSNFDFLLNLGSCFLRLEEYKLAIETLEYAKSSYTANAKLLSILAEAYFHSGDLPKSLLYFREAFYVDPSQIDLGLVKAKPVRDIIEIIKKDENSAINDKNMAEWIPAYAFINDVFYVRRNTSRNQIETIEKEIYNLELNYQKLSREQLDATNIVPRLINKYLWLLDYYEFQNYSFENISEIRERLIKLDRRLFQEYFGRKKL